MSASVSRVKSGFAEIHYHVNLNDGTVSGVTDRIVILLEAQEYRVFGIPLFL